MNHLGAALDAMGEYYRTIPNPSDELKFQEAKMRGTIRAYHSMWSEQTLQYDILEVERTLTAPLKSLETGKSSSYTLAGKLDVIMRERTGRNRLFLLDHKFMYKAFSQDDIEHLLVSGQPNHYSYLGWANGIKLEAVMWDVIAKSQLRPRKESSKIVRAARQARLLSRAYTDPDTGVHWIKGQWLPERKAEKESTPAETTEEFEDRVYQALVDGKQNHFARPVVPVIKNNMANYIHELYLWVKELDMDSRGTVHLKNDKHCMMFGTPCEFLGVCTGKVDINDDNLWVKKPSIYPELELAEDVDPFKIITNSRMGDYKGCRLKHHRRYNLGIERRKADEKEALIVGTAGHVALEAMFKSIAASQGRNLYEKSNNSSTGSSQY